MLVRAPLMEAEQHGSIRIEDLTKVVMAGRRLGLAEERLVPFEATGNVADADDRPCAFHRSSAVGLTRIRRKSVSPISVVLREGHRVKRNHAFFFITCRGCQATASAHASSFGSDPLSPKLRSGGLACHHGRESSRSVVNHFAGHGAAIDAGE